MILTLGVRPSGLREVYWSHTLDDLKQLTSLHMQREIVRSMAFTESLVLVASKIFGGSKPAGETTTYKDAASAIARGGIK